MYNPSTRLLSIINLLHARSEVSAQELAQVLEVEERSVRRYIMLLRDMGIPIESSRGRHGGYSLEAGFRLPPLMFTTEEITAVMMGLMLMHELGSTSRLAIESAAARIERVLPADLRQSTVALRQSLVLDDVQSGTYKLSTDWILIISQAVHEGKCLNISYASADGELTQRLIEPYGLVLHARTWYLPAYCHLREDMRVFRVDRVRSIEKQDQSFTFPVDFNALNFVLASLARLPGTYCFEIILDALLSTAQEIISPSTAVLEATGEQTLMRCYSDNPEWLARYLTGTGLRFTVRQTDELREALRSLAAELLASANSQS